MKGNRIKKIIRTMTLFLMLNLSGIGFFGTAYGSSRATTIENYRIEKCRLRYNSSIGNMLATWDEPEKKNDAIVTLYLDNAEVNSVTVSGTSWDFTEDVLSNGPGRYRIKVYPSRLGEDYTKTSAAVVIKEKQLEKMAEYDPDEYMYSDCKWEHDSKKGAVTARWYKSEKLVSARIGLFKGSSQVDGWKSTGKTFYDFSKLIAKSGSGTYYFEVYPKDLGDTYVITSEELYISSEDYKIIKNAVTEAEKAEEARRVGWYRDGVVWRYYKSPGVQAKKEWITYQGKQYHFSSTGIMQIGWQAVDDCYYFFDTEGALVTGPATISGYRINEKGQRTDEKGNVVSSKGQRENPAQPTILSKVTIAISETGKEPGKLKTAAFNNGTGYKVNGISYSVPVEKWAPGESVRVTMKITANSNYYFAKDVKFTARNCRSVSSTGNSVDRTVQFSYYPKTQLAAPDTFYIKDDYTLCWRPVKNAKRYRVVITEDGGESTSSTVTTNEIDISELEPDNYINITIKIYAMASAGSTYYLQNSETVQVPDLAELVENNKITGEIKWTTQKMRYYDEDGSVASGWRYLLGNWYHFSKSGYAFGPGWYKDTNGYWYYFDGSFRMCTGKKVIDGKEYFLNDGSIPGLPLGAWKE